MPKDTIITGLDVGTGFIRVVIGQIKPGEARPQIIGLGEARSFGLRRGVVVDIRDTVKSIRDAVEMASRSSGFTIHSAFVSLGGSHLQTHQSKGVVAVSRADGEISEEDVERVLKAAQAISLSPNREIVHVLPINFNVDGQEAIKDPTGMSGVRLEVNCLILEGASPFIKNLTKCINEAGLEIDGLVVSALASSEAVLTRRQKELGVLCVDIGAGQTGLTIYEEGDIIHIHILPVGASHITNDIAIGLRTDIDLAEKIKLEYASVLPEEINEKTKINLADLSDKEQGRVPRYEIAQIVRARVEEILDLINKELKKVDRQGLLPAGVVLLGGGAKMVGMVDLVKERLRLPAQIGFPQETTGILDQVDDPCYATALGLIYWGTKLRQIPEAGKRSSMGGVLKKIKKAFKIFTP